MAMRKFLVAVLIVLLLAISFWFSRIKLRRSGEEFSPQTFELRTFEYFEPILWPTKKYNMDRGTPVLLVGPAIAKHLRPAAEWPQTQWDLVSGQTVFEQRSGAASVLVQYLQITSDETAWDLNVWSDREPELAAILWPHVQMLAANGLYFAVPSLIRQAVDNPPPAELRSFCLRQVAEAAAEELERWSTGELTDEQRKRAESLLSWVSGLRGRSDGPLDPVVASRLDAAIAAVGHQLATQPATAQPPTPRVSNQSTGG